MSQTQTQEVGKPSKYKDRLALSQEQVDSQQIQFKERKAKHGLDSRVLATEEKVADVQLKLDTAKGKNPLDVDTIVSLQQELEGYEDGLKRLKALKEELF